MYVSGTNGGVSVPGLLFSALGGTVVGVAYYTTLLICSSIYQLEASPPQWPIIIIATIAGISCPTLCQLTVP